MAKVPVNFLIDRNELHRFDRICGIIKRSRTSVLSQLMDGFCATILVEIKKKNKILSQVDQSLERHNHLVGQRHHQQEMMIQNPYLSDTYDSPPAFFCSDGEVSF